MSQASMSQASEVLSRSVDVAEEVRDFYDRHPYPPPVDDLDRYKDRWQDGPRRRADFHLFWPGGAYREDLSILVAGCGTSQAVKHALRWPAALVTGIDPSATSVRHTERLKKKYELRNLHVHQLAIEQISELGMEFDQIVCTGVLHHLADPDAGLSALRSVLKPDGAMQIMVYAPYGRAGVYMLQQFCRRAGISADNGSARELILALSALPPGHPLQNLLTQAPELRNEAAVADALLHPQDRAYSVPQFLEFVGSNGLAFGRWLRQAPYSVDCGVMATIPQAARLASLTVEEQYAAVELFRGTMIRHSAVVYSDDSAAKAGLVSFAGDDWLNYVPMRMPDTICVQERLPAGAAGVLINRTHTYRDLVLPIGPTEKRIFDAIDGFRTIRAIAETALPQSNRAAHLDMTRGFFERLWWYDQAVFCTKRQSAPFQFVRPRG
jgi:SAM-dependent methyltransferase